MDQDKNDVRARAIYDGDRPDERYSTCLLPNMIRRMTRAVPFWNIPFTMTRSLFTPIGCFKKRFDKNL